MSRGKSKGRGGGQAWRGGKGKGGQGRGGGKGRGNGRWGRPRSEIARSNKAFEEYYNNLAIVSEEERQAFWDAMKSDLPNSFRFAGSRGHALTVQRRLIDHYIPEITAVEYEGQPVSPPTPVDWYPDQLAWTMTTPKNVIRRFPPFASFQKFLVSENNIGNITRQEIVSMIPPLMLDIKPGMTVLDLCAAPGSKSAQIIEMVHGGEEARVRKVREDAAKQQGRELSPEGVEASVEKDQAATEDDWSDDGRPTGLLIANDVDYRRAHMLIHQCKRLNSPNLIITNHDATLFPSIKLPSQSGNKYMKFDRVLADVPCTGDGTTRKNVEIWNDWAHMKAMGLHNTQSRILVRALQMLKVGGKVVYSTCSLNPIENEAVVSSAIQRCGGSEKVQLVDKDDTLPGLKRRPGITSWQVLDKAGRWWTSWADVTKTRAETGDEGMSRLAEDMFPPDPEQGISLERCMRVYPHLQDTGGFFIAVLEKKSEIRAKPENMFKSTASEVRPSVTAVADEIKKNGEENGESLEKLDTLDDLAPPSTEPGSTGTNVNAQPAARQNEDRDASLGEDASASSNLKHALDEAEPADDMATSSKRLKTRNEEEDDPTPSDQPDRLVHHPPPPATAEQFLIEQSPTPATDLASTPNQTSGAPPKPTKQPQSTDESFIFLDPSHPELREIAAFYSLPPRFPQDRYMVRNPAGTPTKSIYYTSALARDILQANSGSGVKFVHCGVKMFVKQDTQGIPSACKWRIQAEGLPIVEPWVGADRVVRLSDRETLRTLLVEMFPRVAADGHTDLGEIADTVRDVPPGCCVLRAEIQTVPGAGSEGGGGAQGAQRTERLVMPLWRGLASLNLMLPKEERKAMLLRIFNDDSPLLDRAKHHRDGLLLQQQAQGQDPQQKSEELGDAGSDADAVTREEDAAGADGDESDGGVVIRETTAE